MRHPAENIMFPEIVFFIFLRGVLFPLEKTGLKRKKLKLGHFPYVSGQQADMFSLRMKVRKTRVSTFLFLISLPKWTCNKKVLSKVHNGLQIEMSLNFLS